MDKAENGGRKLKALRKQLSLALRTGDITEDDLEAISSINRIALNCSFITDLLEASGR